MTAPEVTAAQEQLDGLPEAWAADLAATVLRRARIRGAARVLAERVEHARAAAEAALAGLLAGGEELAGELIFAEQARAAAVHAVTLLPEQSLDQAAVDAAMAKAAQAMAQAASDLRIPRMVLEEEREEWRRASQGATVPLQPPTPTALDLAAQDAVRGVQGPLAGWFDFYTRHWDHHRLTGAGDPLSLLGAAATYVAQAEELTPQATKAREAVEKANAARLAAGRWTVQSAAAAALR